MFYTNLILVDGNHLAYRILTSLPVFSVQYKSEHQLSFFIHSFLYSLQSILKQVEFRNIIICWDSPVNKRKQIYTEYKANRKVKTDEEKLNRNNLYNLMNGLKTELKTLGKWAVIEKEGYEGDDLIAYFLKQNHVDGLIVSTDSDLYQLLNDFTWIFLVKSKQFYGKKEFEKEYKISSEIWSLIKAIAGDKTDNVKGIYRIGIKTAIKLYLDNSSKFDDLVQENRQLIEKNLEIVNLPIDFNINMALPQSYFDQDRWSELFQKNNLKKLDLLGFKKYLNG